MKLIIITPFYNEEQSIALTIDSILRQTLRPVAWLIIDDNSNDSSPDIVKGYAAKYSFIHYVRISEAEKQRATGSNIVRLFNAGLQYCLVNDINWDIVLKLDADIVVQRDDYLSFIVNKFEQYPKLGIASGATYILQDNGSKVIESKHRWHTQGPNKFYRASCLKAIGGLKPFKGWDGVDDILARNIGFITEKFFEQQVHHLYPTQTRQAEGGIKKGLMREASGYNNMGYPFYMYIMKSLKLVKEKGLLAGWYFFFYGLKSRLSQQSPLSSKEKAIVSRFMRKRFSNDFEYTQSVVD